MMNEKQSRIFLASCAKELGYGGIKKVCEISGYSKTTVIKGKKEIASGEYKQETRVRKKGGGRKKTEEKYRNIEEKVRKVIDGSTYGDPTRVLSYTTESMRKITMELKNQGISVSHVTVGEILESMGYSKQQNRKMLQIGEPHPDRNAQFEHINRTAAGYIEIGVPVISVDTKKKESVGNFKNNGQEYCEVGNPRKVLDHDFPLKELGKIAPYGVYNLNNNTGFVNLGTSHDTSEFAVE